MQEVNQHSSYKSIFVVFFWYVIGRKHLLYCIILLCIVVGLAILKTEQLPILSPIFTQGLITLVKLRIIKPCHRYLFSAYYTVIVIIFPCILIGSKQEHHYTAA